MSNNEEQTSQTAGTRPRRSSLAELFASRPSNLDSSSAQSQVRTNSMAAAVTHQAQQPHARRLSITTLGLSGASPTHNAATPFGSLKKGSIAGMTRSSPMDEHAVEDGEAPAPLPSERGEASGSGASGVGRRMSFGARAAYRDMRASGSGGGSEGSGTSVSPPKGFNWSENFRTRAERNSVSATTAPPPPAPVNTARARSTSTTQPAPIPTPPKPVPKVPDAFQERILKGDFYMD